MSTTDSKPAFSFIQQGAIIKEFVVAGRNIVLGFPNDQAYQTHNTAYFGETIGRVANRIQDATIKDLNGKSYRLAANDGPNSLHGGRVGWGKRRFQGPHLGLRDGKETAVFVLEAEHGDEGYPGTVHLSVAYTASTEVEAGLEKALLTIDYEAKLADEQPEGVGETAVNITNHRYVGYQVPKASAFTSAEVPQLH
jgi:aldose 1-epimerase